MNIFLHFITHPDVQVFVYLTVVQDLGQSVIVTSQIMMLMMVLELFLQVRGWTAWSCFLLLFCLFDFSFFFLYNILEYWGYWFRRVHCDKNNLPDYSMVPVLNHGELKDSTIHSLIFLLHIILHMKTTGSFKLFNYLLSNVSSII